MRKQIFNTTYSQRLFLLLRNLLGQLQIKVTKHSLQKIVNRQPHPESLQSIKDSLSEFYIESKVYKFDLDDIINIDTPLIAHLKDKREHFVVLYKISSDTVDYYDPIDHQTSEPISLFLRKWTGIILIPFIKENSGDPDYSTNKKSEILKATRLIGLISLACLCLGSVIFQTWISHKSYFKILSLFLFIKIIGVLLNSIILKLESGEFIPLFTKLCHSTNCYTVLRSKVSRILSWLSVGDIGFIYFTGSLILLIIGPFLNDIYPILSILIVANYFALPFTFISIYYQYFIIKSWCLFCLGVILVLWLELLMGIVLINHVQISLDALRISIIAYFFAILILLFLRMFENEVINARHFKKFADTIINDTNLFISVLQNSKDIPDIEISHELTYGLTNSSRTLIIVINLNCPACIELFNNIRKYDDQPYKKVKIILRFKGSEREESDENRIIEKILLCAIKNNAKGVFQYIDDWQKMKEKSLENKCEDSMILSLDNYDAQATQIRKKYFDWIISSDITSTPAIIFNSKLVPDFYTFHDLIRLLQKL